MNQFERFRAVLVLFAFVGTVPCFPAELSAGDTQQILQTAGGAERAGRRCREDGTSHSDCQQGGARLDERSENWMANRMDDARGAKQWHGTVGNEMDDIVRAE